MQSSSTHLSFVRTKDGILCLVFHVILYEYSTCNRDAASRSQYQYGEVSVKSQAAERQVRSHRTSHSSTFSGEKTTWTCNPCRYAVLVRVTSSVRFSGHDHMRQSIPGVCLIAAERDRKTEAEVDHHRHNMPYQTTTFDLHCGIGVEPMR